MSIRFASDLTAVELRDKLKELGLSSSGNKNELIARLNQTVASSEWFEKRPVTQATESTREAAGVRADEEGAHGTTTQEHFQDVRVREMKLELELLKQEIELLRTQPRTAARMSNAHVDTEIRPVQSRINIGAIAELIATFDGTKNNFEIWESQLRLLKRTYRLDEEHTRVLIGMRLKGKALEWLHSRAELVEISVEALLCELKAMFDHRPSKVVSRRQFEERMWKKGETFSDYMQQKVILGNRISIEEEELVEYIIDGIPNRILRDQARISGLRTRAALVEAFERITLWDQKHTGTRNGEEKTPSRPRVDKSGESGKSEQKASSSVRRNCYNCGMPDHLSKDCPTKESGPKCFKCGKRGHIAAKCSGERAEVKDSYAVTQLVTTQDCKLASHDTMSIEALSGKVFLLVTGASRGIGRQIAITFGSLLEKGSHVLLLARNKDGLHEAAKNIPSKVKVCTISTDLGKTTVTEFKEFISESLKETTPDAFDRMVLVHNVGSLGDMSQTANEILDINIWRNLFDLNFSIPALLNAVVMNTFSNKNIKKTVINITSLYAIQAGIGSSQYSSVKAAREMYFKVFALENPDVNVLNYAPGPVDTDMFAIVCENLVDLETRKQFNEMREKKTILSTEQTVNRLVQVLRENKYKPTDHVDYYDEL